MTVNQMIQASSEIIDFWFTEIDRALWFKKDADFDQLLLDRFGALHAQASLGELSASRDTPQGRLAEIIVLDQFSRNLYRDSPRAFAQDGMALALAQEAVRSGADAALTAQERVFLYMPYMHSESAVIHETAVELFTRNGIANNLEYELKHKAIIDRFGRYPHRNVLLGRASTSEEIAFLQDPGSSF